MSQHLSAQQRQILSLQKRIAELEQMQKEYNAFMNYVVYTQGDYDADEETREFTIKTAILKKLDFLPIKSVISDDGKFMTLTRVDGETNNHSRIILP